MLKRVAPAVILVLLLMLNVSGIQLGYQNTSAIKLNYQNINNINNQTANIGEVFAERAGFGFIGHELNIHNVKVKWIAENGKINGTVEMNYSIYHLFEKKIPRFIATGYSVYLEGKKLGENSIFTLEKEKKVYRGKLPVNVSFSSNGRSHIVLYANVWFACFPPNPLRIFYQNLTNHGLLNWFTFGTFDRKNVRIDIDITGESKETLNENSMWIHTRHDLQNTGFTPATGRGSISSYRMKILCKHLMGMGTGEQKVADIDNDGKAETIFGTQTGYLYAVEKGWKVDWKCKLNAPDTYMSPELGDVDGDGNYEVIVSSDSIMESETSGLRVVDGSGNLMAEWKNPEGGFPLGEPRAADLNGDGKDEILVGLLGNDKRGNDLYALSYNNGSLKELWKYQTHSWVQWPSAVADINNDGRPEIIFTSVDMGVYCLDTQGNLIWNYTTKGGLQPIYSGGFKRILFHPIAYDINNDGYDEIITTTCLYDKPNWSAVYCLNHNGKLIWKFESGCPIWGPAAVEDLNNDGKPEIIFGDINGTIYAIENDGSLLWEYSLPEFYFSGGTISGAPSEAAFWPYIADLDGDGYPEIILVAWYHGVFIFGHEGKLLKQWPRPLGVMGFGGAAIADIDNDDDLEIVFGIAGKMGIFGRVGILDQ